MKPTRFTRTSRKHRIGKASAHHVMTNELAEDGTHSVTGEATLTWIGDDERGRELHIVAIDKRGCILVIQCSQQPSGKEDDPMPRRKIAIGPIGPDVDLEVEDIGLTNGQRLTNELAEQIAEEALARRRGRPSVTGAAARTPNLTVRVPSTVRDALASIAEAQGRRLADVSRDAMEEYIARHAG